MKNNPKKIIKNLEIARRLSFPGFDNITLTSEAVKVLINLFLHPGCKSDINLMTFLTGQPVYLSDISPHIITAFPSQVALYAQEHQTTIITDSLLLECFAIDHADAVEENQASLLFNPSYSLAHVLTIGRVRDVRQVELRQLADIEVKVCGQLVKFTNILAPIDINIAVNQTVFHHFGVVVSLADTIEKKILARKLQLLQNDKTFLQKTVRQILGANITEINYAKEAFFRVNMAGQIIQESKKEVDFFQLWQEEDLRKIKIPKAEKVMFQS